MLYLTHFIKNSINAANQPKVTMEEMPVDAINTLYFLEELLRFEGSERELVKQNLGSYIFDFFK